MRLSGCVRFFLRSLVDDGYGVYAARPKKFVTLQELNIHRKKHLD